MYHNLIRRSSGPATWWRRAFACCALGVVAPLFAGCDKTGAAQGSGTPPGGIVAADVPPAPRPTTSHTRPADAGPYTWPDY